MKVAKCSGVISSFFLYTGRPWDEIDIEFLGNDTTKVQFNYFTNGQGNHEYIYNLGFDASEDFHEYAFDWQPDAITWYVDGKPVYRAEVSIPSHAGHIMMNLWNVTPDKAYWAGKFEESKLPVSAEYEWIGFSSAGGALK
jgi:beta-glucanase (GH16 family)